MWRPNFSARPLLDPPTNPGVATAILQGAQSVMHEPKSYIPGCIISTMAAKLLQNPPLRSIAEYFAKNSLRSFGKKIASNLLLSFGKRSHFTGPILQLSLRSKFSKSF